MPSKRLTKKDIESLYRRAVRKYEELSEENRELREKLAARDKLLDSVGQTNREQVDRLADLTVRVQFLEEQLDEVRRDRPSESEASEKP